MAFAAINAYSNDRLIMAVSEHTPDFESNTIDHNYLADLIGQAVVRAINHCRTLKEDLGSTDFRVRLYF